MTKRFTEYTAAEFQEIAATGKGLDEFLIALAEHRENLSRKAQAAEAEMLRRYGSEPVGARYRR